MYNDCGVDTSIGVAKDEGACFARKLHPEATSSADSLNDTQWPTGDNQGYMLNLTSDFIGDNPSSAKKVTSDDSGNEYATKGNRESKAVLMALSCVSVNAIGYFRY